MTGRRKEAEDEKAGQASAWARLRATPGGQCGKEKWCDLYICHQKGAAPHPGQHTRDTGQLPTSPH